MGDFWSWWSVCSAWHWAQSNQRLESQSARVLEKSGGNLGGRTCNMVLLLILARLGHVDCN